MILSSNQNMSPVQVLQMMLRYATRHTINFLPLSETHRLITPNLVAAVPAENRKGQWITAETCTQACLHYYQRQQQSKALLKRQIFFFVHSVPHDETHALILQVVHRLYMCVCLDEQTKSFCVGQCGLRGQGSPALTGLSVAVVWGRR